jgi:HAD superfamily hydrolase (TIGR01450 family)
MPVLLEPFDAVLLDLDGTVYHEEHPLPGAVELIRQLQQRDRPFACLSNSAQNPRWVQQRLRRMGLAVEERQIYTAGVAAADYLLEQFPGRPPGVFNLATEGVHELLDGRVRWVDGADEPCDAVVVGAPASVYATDERQRIALHLLRRRREALLVGCCADRVYPSPRGLEFGTGALSHMLAYAADAVPTFCGKPESIFFHELCRRLRVAAPRCVLIGDNLESDIAGGRRVGMTTVLTLSGVTGEAELHAAADSDRPDHVICDLRALL